MTRRGAGFTLIEVMIAVVILAVGLSSLFTSEAGAIRIAQRARTTTIATLLARCKMGEIEEQIAREGWPDTLQGTDECCDGAKHEGFECVWTVERIVLPDQVEGSEGGPLESLKASMDGTSGSDPSVAPTPGAGTDPAAAMGVPLSGGLSSMLGGGGGTGGGDTGGEGDPLSSLVMEYAFPIMKPIIEEQVRRATVTVQWREGSSEQTFELVQFVVNELPMVAPEEGEEEDDPGTDPSSDEGGSGGATGATKGGSSSRTKAPGVNP